MTRALVYVHGHHHKPPAGELTEIWNEALRAGVGRDRADKLAAFDAVARHLVYFGDLNNALLAGKGGEYDARLDVADRRNAIERLSGFSKPKKFNRYNYEKTPGKSALPEFLADIGAPLLGAALIVPAVRRIMPELAAYWDAAGEYYRETSMRTLAMLKDVLACNESVMVIAHGLGGVVLYDALWKLSRGTGDLAPLRDRKIDRLLTLGTPLATDAVRARLAGAREPIADRYPRNIVNWYNVAAEDDFVCHDKTVADDFRGMLDQHVISVIEDYRIYNLAVRYGKSNPHSVVGYLVHPRVAKLLADWL